MSETEQRRSYALSAGIPGLIDALAGHLLSTQPADPFRAIIEWARSRCGGGSDYGSDSGAAYGVSVKVADALSKYDLENAGEHLEKLDEIAGTYALSAAYGTLLDNLVQFLPYLPDEFFESVDTPPGTPKTDSPQSATSPTRRKLSRMDLSQRADESMRLAAAAEIAPSGDVTIVFTDIQGSSQLWGSKTTAMQKALKLHNNLLRAKLQESGGYEVKTLGDAFMVAFQEPRQALVFALSVQQKLTELDWPKELLEHSLCAPEKGSEDRWMWRGLRIRIGMHTGPASVEVNPVTQRADYFGPTVNVAARVEAQSVGGATAVTAPVLRVVESLDAEDRARMGDPVTVPIGEKELKGCGREELWLVLPSALAKRAEAASKKEPPPKQDGGRARPAPLPAQTHVSALETAARKGMRGFRSSVATVVLETAALQPLWPGDREAAAHAMNACVSAVEVAAVRSEGQMYHCGGAGCASVLCWNVTKPCAMHAVQSARFVGLLKAELKTAKVNLKPAVGIAAGALLHAICGQHKKHPLVLGGTVDLSALLAAKAAEIAAFCLSAGVGGVRPAGQEPQLSRVARTVDYWTLRDGTVLAVDELNADGLTAVVDEGSMAGLLADDAEPEGRGWGAECRNALLKADSGKAGPPDGDCGPLRALCEEVPADEVLRKVAEMKAEGRRLVAGVPKLLLPQVGRQRGAAVRAR
eukprot:TRINITY_DN15598_c2_g1_i1.p1 TRINITY_DN15598_c2_g1~~TRINITY_DN15598_c2_g1_i1.p1  ORF type:complete len:717 (+),score=200.37 TRINITY_DN15598_c2_g1_i1:63-2153(+)